ncbi:GpE family phage tail protein [Desulfovibrio sp.]
MILLAWLYHWPPSELERMTARDLAWWAERTKKLQKLMEHD